MARVAVQAEARAGAVALLRDYAADASLKLQVYPGRPRSILTPTAFVDAIGSVMTPAAGLGSDVTPAVEIVCLWGTFDSMETVNQRDAFIDGFYAWCADRPHALHENSIVERISVNDDPVFVPDWLPPDQQKAYYATRITLEGLFPNT